jgi:hypothetical protein
MYLKHQLQTKAMPHSSCLNRAETDFTALLRGGNAKDFG